MRGLITALLVYAAKRPLSRSVHRCLAIKLTTARNVCEDASHRGGVPTRNLISVLCIYYFIVSPVVMSNTEFIVLLSWIFNFFGNGPHKASQFPCEGDDGLRITVRWTPRQRARFEAMGQDDLP